MTEHSIISSLLERLVPPLVFLLFILFGVGWLLPRFWIVIEWIWWRLSLGGSTAGRLVRSYAIKDIQLLIHQKEIDDGATRPLAVVLALITRLIEFPRMKRDLNRMKAEKVDQMFESAIESLNEGWRSGTPPQILSEYMRIIDDTAYDKAINTKSRIRGLCAVANVKYLLGSLREGNALAKRNWENANRSEREDESEFKWMASYAYFNSTMFLGNFETAMNLMAEQWSKYYASLEDSLKESIRLQLANKLTLNPVISIPRHIILAAAFNEGPIFAEDYWPSKMVYKNLSSNERESEIKWVGSWYEEAKSICASEIISLDFSHAYTGFYFTLLLGEAQMQQAGLNERINEAFDSIEESSPIVSRYAKYGFYGVYHLVCGRDKKALDNLRRAAEYSSISGNKFADCLFMCCHAVAAARLNSYLEPEVNYYLAEAEKLANTIGGNFYPELRAGAFSAVCELRGEKGKAQRYAVRSRQGRVGERILKIFQKNM